ncbi:MAG: hypothetical protein LBR55_05860, partial [Bacteroidales bacterium]|nr:hypothetical protein [Bacteroidales bacterium]
MDYKGSFALTPLHSLNGEIIPNETQIVDSGASKSFTITPNAGYRIATVTVDDNPVTVTDGTY